MVWVMVEGTKGGSYDINLLICLQLTPKDLLFGRYMHPGIHGRYMHPGIHGRYAPWKTETSEFYTWL